MEEIVKDVVAPVVPSAVVTADKPAAPVVPAQESKEASPVKSAVASDKDQVLDVVTKKDSLLGIDPDAEVAEGEKEGEEVKGDNADKSVVPEKYDVKVPEGMTLNSDLLEAVTPVFKDLGITQDAAQKLIDAYAPVIAKQAQAQHDAAMQNFDKQIESWGEETKKMLGPDHMKQMAPASKLINAFAGAEAPALRQLLTDTGLGNHPLMVKFMIAAGKAISADKFVEGGNNSQDDSVDAVKGRFYPSMSKR